MNERYLKARLARELRDRLPRAAVYRHEDKFTAGIPDFSISLDGVTVWAEVKYDRPGRRSSLTKTQEIAIKKTRALVVRYATLKEGSGLLTEVRCANGATQSVQTKRFDHAMVVREIERALTVEHSMVRDFHQHFGLPTPSRPRLDLASLFVRHAHLEEEVGELGVACGCASGGDGKKYFPEIADALVDIVYVAIGTAINLGLPWRELFRRVHEANMRKERSVCNDGDHSSHGVPAKEGIFKPAGWVAPDVRGALLDAGWKEED